MPLDKSFIGREYPPAPVYWVGREKIREFAVAVGSTSPLHTDSAAAQAAGYADVIAPPTFGIVISMPVSEQAIHDPDLGLDYSKVVHGEQRFTYTRPIQAGDRLVGVLHIDNIRAAAGNDILTTRAEVATVEGEHVFTATGVIVARGTAEEE